MNFLAHIYLSFDDREIALGNFFADHIRGNKFLHREIDTFTDAHPIARQSSKRLHKNYGHYSQIIVDIYYDHFLAKNWTDYSPWPLEEFVARFYALLEENHALLPAATQHMMPYMIGENWLVSYASLEGISKVLNGMNRRTRNRSRMNHAIVDLQEHYGEFEQEFTAFFKELILFSQERFKAL